MRISDWSSDVCSSDLLASQSDPTRSDWLASGRCSPGRPGTPFAFESTKVRLPPAVRPLRSEEHTSELQSLMRISYAVFCLKKKKAIKAIHQMATSELQQQQQHTSTTKHHLNAKLIQHDRSPQYSI